MQPHSDDQSSERNQGSVRFLTDSSGNVVQSYEYSPHGELVSSNGSVESPYLYSGEQYDEETGLIYLRARYYDPETGRFISRDPVRGTLDNPLSQNPYQYALDNPMAYTDPSGEFVWDAVDVGFFFLSLKDYEECPSFWNGLQLGADTVSLLPGLPSLGWVLRADDVGKFIKKGGALKPINAPSGTKPIDQVGLSRDVIHAIKKDIGARPNDWTGVTPNGDVITAGPDGKTINHGKVDGWLY